MKALRQFSSKNVELDRFYQNVAVFAAQFADKAILDGRLIEGVSLASGDTTINHGLGRPWRGWIVVDKQATADIYATAAKQTQKSKTLVLTSSAAVTASLYVF